MEQISVNVNVIKKNEGRVCEEGFAWNPGICACECDKES